MSQSYLDLIAQSFACFGDNVNCYYQRRQNDAKWMKGEVVTMPGNFVYFAEGGETIELHSAEVYFEGNGFRVTGWEKLGDNSYKITSVQAQSYKPKDMK